MQTDPSEEAQGHRTFEGPLRRFLFLAIAVAMAAIPSLLAVRDRWLGDPPIRTPFSALWLRTPFLRTLVLPSYFGLVLFLYLGLIVLFWLRKGDFRMTAQLPMLKHHRKGRVSRLQSRVGSALLPLSALGVLAILYRIAARKTLPGWDLASVIVVELLGKTLSEVPAEALVRL